MPNSIELRRPRPLLPGGHIAVLSIGSPSDRERIVVARSHLEARGYRVSLAGNLHESDLSYLAGSDVRRIEELNRHLRSDAFDAFFFSRGGYGAMRILDGVDYEAIRSNPRALVGYSDVTALHQAVAVRSGISGFHGPMMNFDLHEGLSPEIDRWCWSMLEGTAPLHWRLAPEQVMAPGRAEGVLFGGCLSLSIALMGTPYDYWIDDGIWFWEDVSEPTYRIDRMLTQLRLAGRLERLRAVMIGRLKGCGGSDQAELDTLIESCFSRMGIPVLWQMPFGHWGDNLMLPVGRRILLDTESLLITLPEPAVEPIE
ncbi:MAG TPA: LD-carboxypeptidase [Thermoanaerobaculia bacterium]|nr:LD-carboxypeptidase [Thermoanaerobaculia bacterium]